MHNRLHRGLAKFAAGVAALLLIAGAAAQPRIVQKDEGTGAIPEPPVAEAVRLLLDQEYLKEEERARLRIEHGVWEEADLGQPALAARAALLRGAHDAAALRDPAASIEDRAEAAIERGEVEAALTTLENAPTVRAARLRAEALVQLGRFEDAARELETLRDRVMGANAPKDAAEIAEGVRGLISLADMKGVKGGAADYHAMAAMLAKARDEVDPLSPRVPLTEAVLFFSKDNYPDAGQALESALRLSPRSAEAWGMAGMGAVAGFDVDRVERIALRLEALAAPSVSIEAALIRCAMRLRQSDGESALEALRPALAAYPGNRRLLAAEAAATAASFNPDRAAELLAAFDAIAPGSAMAYLAAGRAMADARQYEEAAAYLAVASERAPNWAEPVIELGLSEMQAGRNAEALAALRRATDLDPFNTRAANTLTLVRELQTYVKVESDHFIVRCKPGIDELVAREMLPELERIFTRVTGAEAGGIDHKPANKTVVELYPNHRWFAVRITGMTALHTIAAATGPVIAMEAPREGPGQSGPYDWARVVQHEYTHTVTLSRTKNRLPHWFTEAGAVYLEDAPRGESTCELLARAWETGTLFTLEEINPMFVRPKKPTDRAQAYAQGHWMYEFMIERWGAKAPLELMDLYAAGVREEAAFTRVLGVGREEFMSLFRQWGGEQLRAWGMLPPEGVPTVKELLAKEPGENGEPATEATDEMIERWLVDHPEHPDLLAAKVRTMAAAAGGKATPEMVPWLERYAMARPVAESPHKLLAALYMDDPDVSKAAPHLEFLDAREQRSPGFAAELARRYAAMGDMTSAVQKAERATRIAPYDARTRETAATIALRAGNKPLAERHIRALTVIEPDREIHKRRLEAILKMQ